MHHFTKSAVREPFSPFSGPAHKKTELCKNCGEAGDRNLGLPQIIKSRSKKLGEDAKRALYH